MSSEETRPKVGAFSHRTGAHGTARVSREIQTRAKRVKVEVSISQFSNSETSVSGANTPIA